MFAPEIYRQRRDTLATSLPDSLILLLGNVDSPMNYTDNIFPFIQDSNFRYYFGLNEPGLAGLIDTANDSVTLFGNEAEVADIVWTGPQPSLSERATAAGITQSQPYAQLKQRLATAQAAGIQVQYLAPYRGETILELANLLSCSSAAVKAAFSTALAQQVIAQREIKSADEIKEMETVLAITRDVHHAAMRASQANVLEHQVVGLMEGIVRSHDLQLAYPSIFSRNGEVLHNHHHHQKLQKGDLVLNDTGATSSGGYASDITRTIPVGGKFSPRQRELYDTVLAMQTKAIAALKPGLPYLAAHKLAAKVMVESMSKLGFFNGNVDDIVESGAYAIAFPHGLGHQIGLDVHDMESLGENLVGYGEGVERSKLFGMGYLRLGKPLKAGMVITVEPGIYFIPALIATWKAEGRHSDMINYAKFEEYQDFGGIRIEDNVLITETGSHILGPHIARTAAEVEAIMAAS
jgi:Xaa-Pro aminopeptidase